MWLVQIHTTAAQGRGEKEDISLTSASMMLSHASMALFVVLTLRNTL